MGSTAIGILWTEFDPDQRPPTSWLTVESDDIVYNDLLAQYDPNDPDNNVCRRSDTLESISLKISPEEAEVCYSLLRDTCEIVAERSCPCFSLDSLLDAEDSIRAGDTILDQEKTCVEPAGDYDQYGLIQISQYDMAGFECDGGCMSSLFTVNGIGNMCLVDSDMAYALTADQALHCKRLMKYTCAGLVLDLPEEDEEEEDEEGEESNVECPCFNRSDGLMWAYTKNLGMSADFER